MLIRYPRGFDHLPRRCPATMFSYGRRRSAAPCLSRRYQKKPSTLTSKVLGSGDVLLSHGLSPHYHRGCSVSLPCSEWERVVPLRYYHQRSEPDWRFAAPQRRQRESASLMTMSIVQFQKNCWFSEIYIQEGKANVKASFCLRSFDLLCLR